jgi:hypothetical protein
LDSGTLSLGAPGSYVFSLVGHDDCSRVGGGSSPNVHVYSGTWTLEDRAITLSFAPSGGASRTFHGTADGARVTVTVTDGQVFATGAMQLGFAR